MRQSLRIMCLAGLSVLMLTACAKKPVPAMDGSGMSAAVPEAGLPASGTSGEAVSGTQAELTITTDDSDKVATDDGNSYHVIADQSFDLDLEGWGALRFVSCEPGNAADTPHFYLMREGKIVYTFPWEDRGGERGDFESVRFVAFPDIDGDGRKDVVIGVGTLLEQADAPARYCRVNIFFDRGDRFELATDITDQVNAALPSGETEYGDVMKLVEETPEKEKSGENASDLVGNSTSSGMIGQITGEWSLDGGKTSENLKSHSSLQEMFGTGLKMGAGVDISDSGMLEYHIGIGIGGKGQCEESGDTVTVHIVPYQDLGDYQEILELHLVAEDDQQYLVMSYDGEDLYWVK